MTVGCLPAPGALASRCPGLGWGPREQEEEAGVHVPVPSQDRWWCVPLDTRTQASGPEGLRGCGGGSNLLGTGALIPKRQQSVRMAGMRVCCPRPPRLEGHIGETCPARASPALLLPRHLCHYPLPCHHLYYAPTVCPAQAWLSTGLDELRTQDPGRSVGAWSGPGGAVAGGGGPLCPVLRSCWLEERPGAPSPEGWLWARLSCWVTWGWASPPGSLLFAASEELAQMRECPLGTGTRGLGLFEVRTCPQENLCP